MWRREEIKGGPPVSGAVMCLNVDFRSLTLPRDPAFRVVEASPLLPCGHLTLLHLKVALRMPHKKINKIAIQKRKKLNI